MNGDLPSSDGYLDHWHQRAREAGLHTVAKGEHDRWRAAVGPTADAVFAEWLAVRSLVSATAKNGDVTVRPAGHLLAESDKPFARFQRAPQKDKTDE